MTDGRLELVIADKNLSSWSLRPWLVLRQAGIAFVERPTRLSDPTWRDTIGALSPSRRVPALHHDGAVVWDSLAIAEYVAELFPDAHLWPDDARDRAMARSVSAEMHSGFAALRAAMPMDVVSRHPPPASSPELEADVARIVALWTTCRERTLSREPAASAGPPGPFLFGRFSIADAMFAPVVWRFRTYGVATTGEARAYQDAMLALPAMRAWEADAETEVAELRASDLQHLARSGGAPAPCSARDCFAVIVASQRRAGRGDDDAHARTTLATDELAASHRGYLGGWRARDADGFGIAVSYWDSRGALRSFEAEVAARAHAAGAPGPDSFYERYEVRVCTVEQEYSCSTSPTRTRERSFMGSFDKVRLPSREQALPGRSEALHVASEHAVLPQARTVAPFPEGLEMAMFGMGCFWGAERKLWQAPGVYSTMVGYAAGLTPNATYKEVCSGMTGHNEVVRVLFDPRKTSYEELLRTFWENHDPTQGMRQGNDVGSQYRSGVYVYGPAQRATAEASRAAYQEKLRAAGFGAITTEILDAPEFYYAEYYHQQYLAKNPVGYCGIGGTGVACPVGLATS